MTDAKRADGYYWALLWREVTWRPVEVRDGEVYTTEYANPVDPKLVRCVRARVQRLNEAAVARVIVMTVQGAMAARSALVDNDWPFIARQLCSWFEALGQGDRRVVLCEVGSLAWSRDPECQLHEPDWWAFVRQLAVLHAGDEPHMADTPDEVDDAKKRWLARRVDVLAKLRGGE